MYITYYSLSRREESSKNKLFAALLAALYVRTSLIGRRYGENKGNYFS